VIHITRSLAIELARKNIRVNCIAPAHSDRDQRNLDHRRSCGRCSAAAVGSPRDVAEAFVYLASDRAAQITDRPAVDGGPPRSAAASIKTSSRTRAHRSEQEGTTDAG